MIQMADGGTLFLDEIGELPLSMQTKLLHVIQNKHILRVGGTSRIGVDFRLITATNKDLWAMTQTSQFREDLYYRLNVVPMHIPPLRERKEDIVPLSKHFLDRNNQKYGQHKFFSRETMESFLKYDWPGNIRELENLVERLVVIEQKQEIDYLCEELGIIEHNDVGLFAENRQLPLRQALEWYERKLILEAYEKYGSSVKVGRALGIGQTTASKKIRKYLNGNIG